MSKLKHQAAVLKAVGAPSAPVSSLINKVRSGDPNNTEAVAARRYWPLLMSSAFRRDQDAEGVNGMLNYGYAILRSATARSVIAAGLHPTLGLHHSSQENSMRLVDDLMEPFRPLIDLRVWGLVNSGVTEVNPEAKKTLSLTMFLDRETSSGVSPLALCIERLANSLVQVFLKQRKDLAFPVAAACPLN